MTSGVSAGELPVPVEIVGIEGYAESGGPDPLPAGYHLI